MRLVELTQAPMLINKNYDIDAGMANKIFFNQTNNTITLYKLCYKLCYFSK
jgi:hypothetical protein